MKKLGILIIALIIGLNSYSQENILKEKDGKIYLNDNLYSGKQEVNTEGVLVAKYLIKDGLRDGEVEHFYSNQKTKETGFYSNGEKDGKWEKWDENGNKIGEAYYSKGKKTGTWIVWDHNGIKRYEMHYSEGQKTGTWRIWNSEGQIAQEKTF